MAVIKAGCRVGMLTVAEPTDRRRNGYIIWKCRCDCGGEILLDTRRLGLLPAGNRFYLSDGYFFVPPKEIPHTATNGFVVYERR